MKKCKCGLMIASNARVCPHCGNRFTHPFVKGLAWFIGITVVLFWITSIVGSRNPSTETPPTASRPDAVANPVDIAIKPTKDEAASVIKLCGRPDRDFLEQAPGTTIRHLVYRQSNTELFFYKDAKVRLWVLGNAFLANKDENITMEEANRRMPCARGKLRSFLDAQ